VEKLFKLFAQLSASFVFVILVATVIVLYITAKPAIEEFGAHFIIEPRWGVEVTQNKPTDRTPAGATANSGTTKSAVSDHTSTTDNSTADTNASDNTIDDSMDAPMDDSMDNEFGSDENIPMDDDTDTGQANLPDTAGKNTKILYGGAIPIIGTLFSTLIAMLFAIPVSMGIAVFLSEIANQHVARPIGVAIELLAAIPSIIYGMLALFWPLFLAATACRY